MHKLSLAPDENGYTANDGEGSLSSKLDGGASKYRKTYMNAPTKVTCQWTCNASDYAYLRTFYNIHEYGTKPFLMDLVMHTPYLDEYEVRFIANTFRLTKVQGDSYIVRADLEVIPNDPDATYDEGFVVSYEAFGEDATYAFGLLETLVNVNFDEAMGA